MADEYYEISPIVRDIDFFIGDDTVFVNSFVTSSVDVSATVIKLASSSSNIQTSDSFTAIKILTAAAESEIELIFETVPIEILNVLTHVDIVVSPSVSISKIAFANCSIDISTATTANIKKITNGQTISHILMDNIVNGTKIAKASSSSSIVSSTAFHSTFIALAYSQVSIISKTIFKPPIRFSPNYIDESSIRTLLILDGKPLTNHSRTLDISLSPVFIETSNWNNKKNRYYKRSATSGRKTFSIDWKNLPNAMEKTVDLRHGRDYIHSIAEDPDAHELKIINQNESGVSPYTETTYTVFITGYNETLNRRYISDGVYLYDCNLTLEEV